MKYLSPFRKTKNKKPSPQKAAAACQASTPGYLIPPLWRQKEAPVSIRLGPPTPPEATPSRSYGLPKPRCLCHTHTHTKKRNCVWGSQIFVHMEFSHGIHLLYSSITGVLAWVKQKWNIYSSPEKLN